MAKDPGCTAWPQARGCWCPGGQGAEAAGSAAAWPTPASGRPFPLLLCQTFPVRVSDESGHRWPSFVLWMNREVSALHSWGQLPGGLRYVSPLQCRTPHVAPPRKPAGEMHYVSNAGRTSGSRTAPDFQPRPHSTLTAGHLFKHCFILPWLSRVTRAESLPLPGPRPNLRPPHLGKPLWIIVSKLLV